MKRRSLAERGANRLIWRALRTLELDAAEALALRVVGDRRAAAAAVALAFGARVAGSGARRPRQHDFLPEAARRELRTGDDWRRHRRAAARPP